MNFLLSTEQPPKVQFKISTSSWVKVLMSTYPCHFTQKYPGKMITTR
jgi:hypothetical protein